MSSLPNIHPLLVHFPLALSLTAFGFDVACVLWRRRWLDSAALALYVVAAMSGVVTAVSGKLAFEGFESLSSEATTIAGEHSDWAFASIVLLALVCVLRWEAFWRDRNETIVRRHRVRWIALALGLVVQGTLYETAEHGGELVYRHGVGVTAPRSAPPD